MEFISFNFIGHVPNYDDLTQIVKNYLARESAILRSPLLLICQQRGAGCSQCR
jgi:hypothetical protein